MTVEILFLGTSSLLVYAYLIYPAVAVLIGGGHVEQPSEGLVPISVLVPAHNEASVMAKKIENFLQIDYPAELIELVIADDCSTDGTAEIVRQHACDRVRLLELSDRGGKAAAMNRLVSVARHPILLFTDANVMLKPSAVRRMVDHLGSKRVGAVTGEVRLLGSDQEFRGEALYYYLERRIQGAESRLGSVMGVDGGMYLLRRELYDTLPADTILDDFLVSMLVMRLWRRIAYESGAKATESGTPATKQEFARRVRIAAGAIQLLKRGYVPRLSQPVLWFQFISHKLLRWFSPVLLAVSFISNLALLSQQRWYQIVFAAQAGLYVAILATYLAPRLRKTRLGILFYLALSQVAMAVGLTRGLLNRQPPQWEKGQRVEELSSSSTNA